jgi:membrane protein required for colicin V production
MPALDWIFVSVLLFSMLLGAWRGLVYEVLSLVSWVVAFVMAQWFAPEAAQRLPMSGFSEVARYAAGFVLVFIAALMLGGLIAVTVKKLMASVGLRPVDRVMGAVFGLLRGGMLLLVATVLVSMTALKDSAAWQESAGARGALIVLGSIRPALPRDWDRFLPA